MPYTLAKFFLWGLLMALAGGIVGWLLRSLKCRAEVARARTTTVDDEELDRLRGRLANLEPVVAERDRLRMELADVRGSSAGALGFSSVPETPIIPNEPAAADAVLDDAPPASFATMPESGNGDTGDVVPSPDDAPEPKSEAAPPSEAPAPGAAELDLAEASTVLGKKIRLDDLTVVEGIGPKISELCNGIGVNTWAELAGTDVETLQSMLNDAGSRFQMHKPGSWPRQAELLATGKWAEFGKLTEELTGGT